MKESNNQRRERVICQLADLDADGHTAEQSQELIALKNSLDSISSSLAGQEEQISEPIGYLQLKAAIELSNAWRQG